MKDNRKHVVQIIPTLRFGGAEKAVVSTVNNLDPKKFRSSIILFFDDQPFAEKIRVDCPVYVIKKKGKISLHLFSDLKKVLQELKPDLVHTHLFGGDVWGRIAAKRLNIPVVTTEHNLNLSEGFIKNFVKRRLRSYSKKYIACSQAVVDYMKKVYKIKDVIVIHYGIELDKLNTIKSVNFKNSVNFLILGRLTKQKGHSIALRALSELKDYDWQLKIVGSGEDDKKIENIIKKLNISDRVKMFPATDDVPGVLQKSDVMLVPSLWEGLGLVVMEGMSAGRVVIGAKVDGISELIRGGENGFLVSPNNKDEWKKVLRDLFADLEYYAKIAKQSQKFSKINFTTSRMIDKYTEIYLEVLK
jgi:glycosyltransferase involved in cell wall biosynthesis